MVYYRRVATRDRKLSNGMVSRYAHDMRLNNQPLAMTVLRTGAEKFCLADTRAKGYIKVTSEETEKV